MEEQKKLWNELTSEKSLVQIQDYIKKMDVIRGFSDESIEQSMLLLTEEVGELAKAIRKEKTSMKVDKKKINNYSKIESEAADVFFVLCAVCNKLDIDLFSAFKDKEEKNIERVWTES